MRQDISTSERTLSPSHTVSRRSFLCGAASTVGTASLGYALWGAASSSAMAAATIGDMRVTYANAVQTLRQHSAQGNKVNLVTTTSQIADIVRNIAPDSVMVTSLMGEGIDPHSYIPSRRDVRLLSQAQVIFYNGLHLEGMMLDLLHKMAITKPVLAADVLLLNDPEASNRIDQHDPHMWMDVAIWQSLSRQISNLLTSAFPAQADEIKHRYRVYTQTMSKIDEYGKAMAAKLPKDRRVIVTSHDAFRYFGARYGFEVLGIQGISTASQPSLNDIDRIISAIVKHQLPAVFFEASTNGRYVQAIVEGALSRGVPWLQSVGPLYSDSMGPSGTAEGTYVGMMDHNFTTIIGALGGNVPPRGYTGLLSVYPKLHADLMAGATRG